MFCLSFIKKSFIQLVVEKIDMYFDSEYDIVQWFQGSHELNWRKKTHTVRHMF